jgi:hypothetical protein
MPYYKGMPNSSPLILKKSQGYPLPLSPM